MVVLHPSQISLWATGISFIFTSFGIELKKQQLFGQHQLLLKVERFTEFVLAQVRSKQMHEMLFFFSEINLMDFVFTVEWGGWKQS